jgi:hypothetical protein
MPWLRVKLRGLPTIGRETDVAKDGKENASNE